MSKQSRSALRQRAVLSFFGVAFVLSATAIVAYTALVPSGGVTLAVGQVASNDILAPRSITYDSTVLTQIARQTASAAIHEIYDPPNPSILRQQIQIARHTLDFINNIRHDAYATPSQQLADLSAISTLRPAQDVKEELLRISDDSWKAIDSEVMSLLERVMRGEVREDNLKDIFANLPNLVGVEIDDSLSGLITALVRDLIKPNAFPNEERTLEARKAAAAAVIVETRTFAQGQIVVRAGTIVTNADMEALTQLKLLQPSDRRIQALAGSFLAVILVTLLSVVYLRRFQPNVLNHVPQMVLIGGLFLVFLLGARLFGTTSEFEARLYPAAAFSLIVVMLAGPHVSIILTGSLAALIGLILGNSLEFSALVAIGGMAGILSLQRVERLNAYLRAGLVIAVANLTAAVFFLLLQGDGDPTQLVTVISAGIINGVISAGLAIVGMYLISSGLNMPTSIRLLELSQPNQPLLQKLLREAPGTYQHSLQVANLAEVAAERIGCNALLTRVAALYHDIGKTSYPHFFVENQVDGYNPHDALNDPRRSAQIIIAHVTDGEKLARQGHLPKALIDFILQHHGTTSVLYFYNKALQAVDCDESRIDKSAFFYPGPRPQTRESGLLMLADTSESTIRAKRPHTTQEIETIIDDIIDSRVQDGQLDDSALTVGDLKIIREVFVSTLQGVFHPRIDYPALSAEPTPREIPAVVLTEEAPPVESSEAELPAPVQSVTLSATTEPESQ